MKKESYCIISVLINAISIVNLSIQLLYNVYHFTQILKDDQYKLCQDQTRIIFFFSQTIILISQISLMTQTYEWFTMLYIILIQKKDSLGELMFKLNNSYMMRKFIIKERVSLFVYVLICLILTAGRYIWFFVIYWNSPYKFS